MADETTHTSNTTLQQSPLASAASIAGGKAADTDQISSLRSLALEISLSSLVSDRTHYLRRYERSFVGEDLCSYLVKSGKVATGREAVIIGNKMLNLGYIQKVYGGRKTFENSRGFYQVSMAITAQDDDSYPLPPSGAPPAAPTITSSATTIGTTSTASMSDIEGEKPHPQACQEQVEGKRNSHKQRHRGRNFEEVVNPAREGGGVNQLNRRVGELESSIKGLEKTLSEARSSIAELLQRQDELNKVHETLIVATGSLQQTLLKLVALCMIVFLTIKVLPEFIGGQLATAVGWLSTLIAGAATITLGGGFKSWATSFVRSSAGPSGRGVNLARLSSSGESSLLKASRRTHRSSSTGSDLSASDYSLRGEEEDDDEDERKHALETRGGLLAVDAADTAIAASSPKSGSKSKGLVQQQLSPSKISGRLGRKGVLYVDTTN
eukprot:jgi/Bigna1/82343/fgenesh1_pg.91_\